MTRSDERIIVEAAPRDLLWGAGLCAQDADLPFPSRWPGVNVLGWALMQARQTLRATAPSEAAAGSVSGGGGSGAEEYAGEAGAAEMAQFEILALITPQRLDNVLSKIGRVDLKDTAAVRGVLHDFCADVADSLPPLKRQLLEEDAALQVMLRQQCKAVMIEWAERAKAAEKAERKRRRKLATAAAAATERCTSTDSEAAAASAAAPLPAEQPPPALPRTKSRSEQLGEQLQRVRSDTQEERAALARTRSQIEASERRLAAPRWRSERWAEQEGRLWPARGQHILAQVDEAKDAVCVYQAYNPSIADYAVENQRFEGCLDFGLERMTWIKVRLLLLVQTSRTNTRSNWTARCRPTSCGRASAPSGRARRRRSGCWPSGSSARASKSTWELIYSYIS